MRNDSQKTKVSRELSVTKMPKTIRSLLAGFLVTVAYICLSYCLEYRLLSRAQSQQPYLPVLKYEPTRLTDEATEMNHLNAMKQRQKAAYLVAEKRQRTNTEKTFVENSRYNQYDAVHNSDRAASEGPPLSASFLTNTVGQQDTKERRVHFTKVGNIYIYGAYLDLRQTGNFSVRLLSVKSQTHSQDSLACYIPGEEGQEIRLYAQTYRMGENHGKMFEGWIFSCMLPPTLFTLPTRVSVAPTNEAELYRKTLTTFDLRLIPNHENMQVNTIPSQNDMDSSSNKSTDTKLQVRDGVAVSVKTRKYSPNITQTNAAPKNKIGVCVPPLFGDLSLSLIVNFIQMCKVQGADQIFLYLGSVSAEIVKFLKYHAMKDNALSIVEWFLPKDFKVPKDGIWYHGQVLAVQDCLYHNMATYSFLLFMDLDEMLIPQHATDWPSMIMQIFTDLENSTLVNQSTSMANRNTTAITSEITRNSHSSTTDIRENVGTEALSSFDERHSKPETTSDNGAFTAALSFRSAFFDSERVPEEGESILYFQHLHRTKSVSHVRNKMLVLPMMVFELGIHHMSKALSEGYKSVDVSEKTALLHHYRVCMKQFEPQMECLPTVKDNKILQYKTKLTMLSHKVMNDASKLFA